MSNKNEGQAFSFDVMVAVVIFLFMLFVFFFVLRAPETSTTESLQNEANIVANELSSGSSPLNIMDNGGIDDEKLQKLINSSYPPLKGAIRVKDDFCIYIQDKSGNLLYLRRGDDFNVTGAGSPIINISDIPCS